jgi:hypothetical protein
MINPGRYNKIDYPGLLGSFIASWILHSILFFIAATTTIFYPPTANREYISVDLMFASPGSKPTDLPQQTRANSPPLPAADQQSAAEDAADSPAPVMSAHADSDLELLKVTAPVPETKKIVPVLKSPPPIIPKKPVHKINPPPPKPVVIPAVVKAPEVEEKETVTPAVAEVAPPSEMAIQSKTIEQTNQEKLAIENEKIRRVLEAEQQTAQLKAEEEAQEKAKAAELQRQEAAGKAARAEKERIHKQQLAAQQAAEEKAREEAREKAIIKAAELQKQQAEKAARAKLAAEKAKMKREAAAKARSEEQARLKLAAEKAIMEKMAHERAAAEKAAQETIVKARLATVLTKEKGIAPIPSVSSGVSGNSIKAQTAVAAPAERREMPLSAVPMVDTKENKLKNQPKRKGFALPPVAGDIKLIITSAEDLVVKALFVSHSRAHHDKPLSKKEAKAQQKLTPIVVRTTENTLEAVIERSHDGIYIFLVEPKGNKPVQGKFSLKLFETKNKPVKSREISGQTEVARLLMPEGILWEDDSAFSGNIEDSDSVTKFNADSGLVWKEYRR